MSTDWDTICMQSYLLLYAIDRGQLRPMTLAWWNTKFTRVHLSFFYLESGKMFMIWCLYCPLQVDFHPDGSKALKLADFGLAIEANQILYTVCGTPTYVAPEILAETGYALFLLEITPQVFFFFYLSQRLRNTFSIFIFWTLQVWDEGRCMGSRCNYFYTFVQFSSIFGVSSITRMLEES